MIEAREPAMSGMVIETDGGLLTAIERRYVTASETGLTIREDLPYDVWAGLVGRLVEAEKRVLWYLGDLVNFGERRYGETYSQVLEATEYAYKTLRNAAWVAGRIELSRRRDNLGLAIHQEVAALVPEDADELLDRYEPEGWNQKELRAQAKERKSLRAREAAKALPVPSIESARWKVERGDATNLPLEDCSVDVIVVSPPYGLRKSYADGDDPALNDGLLVRMLREWHRVARPGSRLAVNVPLDTTLGTEFPRPVAAAVTGYAMGAGWKYHGTIIWNEGNVSKSVARGSVNSPTAPYIITPVEVVLLFSKGAWKRDGTDLTTDLQHDEWLEFTNGLWTFPGESNPWEGFEAAFPEELPRRLIKLLSFREDTVLDPCCGSGTTVVVGARLGRYTLGFDSDPQAVASTLRRMARTAGGR